MLAILRAALAATGLACLSGCGTALWTMKPGDPPLGNNDGAVLSYALAQGQIAFTAVYSKEKVLTLTTDQKVIASADPNKMMAVVYNHSAFADDEIDIQLDGALIKSMSSNSEDKTAAILQSTAGLITQITAAQTAIQKAQTKTQALVEGKAVEPVVCGEMEKTYILNLTNPGESKPFWTHPGPKGCDIHFNINPKLIDESMMGVLGFQTPENADPSLVCKRAVCFRLGGIYKITASASLIGGDAAATTEIPTFTATAPVAHKMGYVKFDRRAFVKNKTAITFGSNGILSGFSAVNPSEVAGFLIIPTAVLAGVAAAAALH